MELAGLDVEVLAADDPDDLLRAEVLARLALGESVGHLSSRGVPILIDEDELPVLQVNEQAIYFGDAAVAHLRAEAEGKRRNGQA